jgi:hypothetical protein
MDRNKAGVTEEVKVACPHKIAMNSVENLGQPVQEEALMQSEGRCEKCVSAQMREEYKEGEDEGGRIPPRMGPKNREARYQHVVH